MKRRSFFGLIGAACAFPVSKLQAAVRPKPRATIEHDGDITRFVTFIESGQDIDLHNYKFVYWPENGRMYFEVKHRPAADGYDPKKLAVLHNEPVPVEPVWEL